MTTPIQQEVEELMKLVEKFGDVCQAHRAGADIDSIVDGAHELLRTNLTTLLTRLRAAEGLVDEMVQYGCTRRWALGSSYSAEWARLIEKARTQQGASDER